MGPSQMILLAALLGLALGQGQEPRTERTGSFGWERVEVPKLRATIPVHGPLQAGNVPVRARQYLSAEHPVALARHFRQAFDEGGLYVPPPSGQLKMDNAFQLTALDPERLVSFTVILAPAGDGNTVVTLAEAQLRGLGQAAPADPLVPEGARDVVSVHQEGARTLSYRTSRSPGQVLAFYRERLAPLGYLEPEPGIFRRQRRQISVNPRAGGEGAAVLVDVRWAPSASP
jgi:hypothetical protein